MQLLKRQQSSGSTLQDVLPCPLSPVATSEVRKGTMPSLGDVQLGRPTSHLCKFGGLHVAFVSMPEQHRVFF